MPDNPWSENEGDPIIVHASSVAWEENAALIIGRSGAGKSTLAIELLGLGAQLVADDRTLVHKEGNDLFVSPIQETAGRIEARGIGILASPCLRRARLDLVVDLDRVEPDRLPPVRSCDILGIGVPKVFGQSNPVLASAVMLYLKAGRSDS